MKTLLKILLALCLLIAAVYAASPLWLPQLLARQLPAGWMLEKLDTGYPGPRGINIEFLRLKGDIQSTGLAVTASDAYFTWQGLKTDAASIVLDVYWQAAEAGTEESMTLDDLVLPVTKLTGRYPQLSVDHLRVMLHHEQAAENGTQAPPRPLVLNFDAFRLVPDPDNSFQLESQLALEDFPQVSGQARLDVNADVIKAHFRFPAGTQSTPWLELELEQSDWSTDPGATGRATNFQVMIDSAPADQEWLDSLLNRGTGGVISHVDGKLQMQAGFSGQDRQQIEDFSLTTKNLHVITSSGTLDISAGLLAKRQADTITLDFPVPADIHFKDTSGWIDSLARRILPEFQRAARQEPAFLLTIASGSRLEAQPGTDRSIEVDGGFTLNLNGVDESLKLQSGNFQLDMVDYTHFSSATATGLINIELEENTAFRYQTSGQELAATSLSVTAVLSSQSGSLSSTGTGILFDVRLDPLASSANRVDMSWQDFDVDQLAGKLQTRTQGFSTVYDGENWSGFDFDVDYALRNNGDVSGSGRISFDVGPVLPVDYSGNAQTGHWNIRLAPATIGLPQLRRLLRVAHYELPAPVKLTDGVVEVQGDIVVGEQLSAKLLIKGNEMGASLLESSTRNANFNFATEYDEVLTAHGPVTIEKILLAGGFELSDISAGLTIENTETLSLSKLTANLFDGALKLDGLRYAQGVVEDSVFELSHINLGKLLTYLDIDGLAGSGFLDIALPVGSDQSGLHISDGSFRSVGGGQLAYTKAGVAGSNIGLKALENFLYKDLSGTINYQSDGAYRIGIRLEGKNPDLYGGHPVVFNLNINGSLPELFEALFITGDFEDAILKQIKIKQP